MNKNSKALQRIDQNFEAFIAGIERCRVAPTFDSADWMDAYGRLARLHDRYMKERNNLTRSERQALSKVFENDSFTKGMINIRQVGEHVKKRIDLVIYTESNTPFTLPIETSAGPLFSAPRVLLTDEKGTPQQIDHLGRLEEMERRIASAVDRAKR